MAAGEGGAVLAVAAADHAHYRDVSAQAVAHHAFIAGGDALVCQLEVAEGVVLVHIDAGVVQHQVGLVQRQQVVERIVHHLEVVGIAHAHGQRNVPVALGLARGEVLFAVQRHGDSVWRVVEDARGAIALVHIAIEDQHAIHSAAGQQVMADHRQVIEDAVRPTSPYT